MPDIWALKSLVPIEDGTGALLLVYALEKLLRFIFFAASCRGGAQTGTDYMTRYKLFIYNICRSTCLHLHISLYRMRVWVRVLRF
jgi:hypothetical protein